MAKNLEQEGTITPNKGLRLKIDRLIRDDEPIINCLVVPRRGQSTANLKSDTESLGVPFKLVGLDKAGLHIEVEQGKIIKLLKSVFEAGFYEKYSFHLEKDEDDGPPEPSEYNEPTQKRMFSKEKEINKLMQVRKPLRKPLQKTSESFDPSKLTAEDISLPGPVVFKQEEVSKPLPTPQKEPVAQNKPELKNPEQDNSNKAPPKTSNSKPASRKPING